MWRYISIYISLKFHLWRKIFNISGNGSLPVREGALLTNAVSTVGQTAFDGAVDMPERLVVEEGVPVDKGYRSSPDAPIRRKFIDISAVTVSCSA